MKILFDGQVFQDKKGVSDKTGKPWRSVTLQDRDGSQFSVSIPEEVKFPEFEQFQPVMFGCDVKIGSGSQGGLYLKMISDPVFK